MATINNSFHGSLGNFSFYERNGIRYVRTKGGASKKQIATSPSCAGIVKSNVEFGGASHVGALLRRAIGPKLKYFSSTNMIGNLTGVLKKMIQMGSGEPGQRILDLRTHGAMLEGFEFNAKQTLRSCFRGDLTLDVSEQRDRALLQARFCPATDVLAPAGATSFQILHTLLCVPRYGLHAVTKKYVPLDDAELTCREVSSPMLFTDLTMLVSLKLPVQLSSAVAEQSALLCIVGIAFYKGSELMKGECGMRVVRVW